MKFIARQETIFHNQKQTQLWNKRSQKSPLKAYASRGEPVFLLTYIRTAVPLTATINIPSRTTS